VSGIKAVIGPVPDGGFSIFTSWKAQMVALVVHASKAGESTRTLFTSPVLTVAKARGLSKSGWQVHVVDADGRVFHPEKFDHLLRFDPEPATKF
jgi:hypothetical protein